MDKLMARMFTTTNAAFLCPILCSTNIVWTEDVETAATNGVTIKWNPVWFESLADVNREMVLLHELWHTARLHPLRKGSRDHRVWNIACDYVINATLLKDGFDARVVGGIYDAQYEGMSEEEVYDILINNPQKQPQFKEDMYELDETDLRDMLDTVIRAAHQATMDGKANLIPGATQLYLDKFTAPKVSWKDALARFMQDCVSEDYSWAKPNRRYTDMYLPSLCQDPSKLEKIICYLDVSGSVSNEDLHMYNSEIHYIKTQFNPEEIRIVQFDTTIQKEIVIGESDSFESIEIIGRGGTCLRDVRKHIEEAKPTAAIIFSDLYCTPMVQLTEDIPILWIIVNNDDAKVSFGQPIYITT